MYLQDFDFVIVYRPNSQITHADYLSRNPVECLMVDITAAEWIQVAQMQDDGISAIRKLLETGDVQRDTKQYFEKYNLKGGVVFRKTESGVKWVVPRAARWNIVKMYHDDLGHFSLDKTLGKIQEKHWFKGMRKFVAKYVKACLNCLYYKNPSGRKPGLLHPIDKVAIPFHTLHLDHLGPFITSKKKNTQILVVVDGFTKFCTIEPVRDTKAKWVLKTLDQMFAVFGVPTRIISDRGTAFTSHMFSAFCQEHGIKHILNAVATPRANGQCERMNRTILGSLAATSAGCPEDEWDKHLKKVQSGLNVTTNRTTQKSPAELLYGYQPRTPADATLLSAIQTTLDSVDLRQSRSEAKRRIDASQTAEKVNFDARRFKPPHYEVGDVVMVASNPAATGQSRKLAPKYKGPFKITAVLPNDRYEVRDLREMRKSAGKRSVVAVDSIKRWITFDALAC